VLEIQAIDAEAASDTADVITVPAVRPLRLEIQDGARRQIVVVDEQAPSRVRVGPGQLEIHVSDGSVYELNPVTDLEAKWQRVGIADGIADVSGLTGDGDGLVPGRSRCGPLRVFARLLGVGADSNNRGAQ